MLGVQVPLNTTVWLLHNEDPPSQPRQRSCAKRSYANPEGFKALPGGFIDNFTLTCPIDLDAVNDDVITATLNTPGKSSL